MEEFCFNTGKHVACVSGGREGGGIKEICYHAQEIRMFKEMISIRHKSGNKTSSFIIQNSTVRKVPLR